MEWLNQEWLRLGVLVFVATFNSFVGLAVLLRKPKDLAYQTFGLLAAFYVLWCVMLGLYEFPVIFDSTLWVKWVFVFVCLFSTCTLFFSFVFPKNITPVAHRLAVLWNCVYLGISCYWLFWTNLFIVGTRRLAGGPIETVMGSGYVWWCGMTWIVLGWAIFNFLYKQTRVHAYQRKHLLYLAIAFGCWGIVTNVLDVVMPIFWHNTHYFTYSALSSLFFTGTVALLILRHGFMDVGWHIIRSIGSTIFTTIIMTGYIALLYSFARLFPPQYSLFAAVFDGFFLMFTVGYVKQAIHVATRWLFFHNSYNVDQVAQTIGEICRAELDLDSLTKQLIELLTKNLMVERVWMEMDCGEEQRFFGRSKVVCLSADIRNKIQEIATTKTVLFFDDMEESFVKDMMRSWQAAALIPLRTGLVTHGVLLVGNPISGSGLYDDDRRLLTMIASPVSVAVQNSLAYETILQFNERLKEEVKLATKQLRETNEKLQEADRMKADFYNVATHELRNPVVGIRGFAGMLKKGTYGPLPEKIAEPISMIWNCNEMLVELVDDLLKIARSETSSFQMKQEDVNITELVSDRIQLIAPTAIEKDLALAYTPAQSPVMVRGDKQRIGEVIHNLLSNAVKYSESGTITVEIKVQKKTALVRITDQGYGISPEDQKKLFSRFFRAQEGIVHGVPGTGLGLYIVRQYIEKMGGEVGVESELGKGSTFWFTLTLV